MGKVIGIDTTYTGNPVSFNAAHGGTMKSIVVPFSPTQDLHGYSSPWPAGGGVNKFDGLWQDVSSGNRYSINYIQITENTEYYICTPHIENDYAYIEWYDEDKTLLSQTYVRNGKKTSPVGAKYARLKCWHSLDVTEIAFNYPSTVTTYSPYSNICPISGLTGLSVYRTGKNLFNKNATDLYAAHALTPSTGATYSAGSYTVTGFIKCKAGEKYITSGTGGANDVCFYDANKSRLSGSANFNTALTAPNNAEWLRFDYKTANANTVQLEQSASATAYEAFGNTYAVDWTTQAGTVYGGTLDVVTGVLTITMKSVDMGTLSWSKAISNYRTFRSAVSGIKYIYTRKTVMSSSYKGVSGNDTSAGADCYIWVDSVNTVSVKDTSKSDMSAADFKAAMSGVQLVYEIATPLTYQLTPKQIIALIGQNYIWSSNNETLNTVLTAPATGFAGWLIKCVTNGTPVEIPLKYMRAETYTVTPDQRMEWSAERDVTGVLHRETVQNLPPKIEFNTPLMTNSDINALNSIIKAAFTNYLQRNITIQFYDPERDQYWEWDCYMPDVKYHIRNADTANNIINYEELRYAFIGY